MSGGFGPKAPVQSPQGLGLMRAVEYMDILDDNGGERPIAEGAEIQPLVLERLRFALHTPHGVGTTPRSLRA